MATSIVTFDFEPFVHKLLPTLDNHDTESLLNPFGAFRGDPKHRTIVCRHWLLGLCQNGHDCGYLHRLDRSKMPTCKHGKLCKIKNCHLKHVEEQEASECIFFKQGFCYNGPNCPRRHVKRLPDDVPKEAVFDLGISAGTTVTTKDTGGGGPVKKRKGGDNYKVSLCNHWLLSGNCHFGEECHFAHGENEIQEGGHQTELLSDFEVYDPMRGRMDAELVLPFALNVRISYFLFQAPDLRALAVSNQRGVWSVPVKLIAEINSALRAYDHVVAYMSVRHLKGIYGIVKISAQVQQPPPHLQHTQMTAEFPVQWLRLVRISMRLVAQLKIGTTGMFVGRTIIDSKFESKVGSEIMYIAYRKPVWDWTQEVPQAEQYLTNLRMMNNEPIPMLPPDALFGPSWIEQQIYGERKPLINFNAVNANASGNGFGGVARPSPNTSLNIYKQELPGFIVMAEGPIAHEMLHRKVFGLPASLKDIPFTIGQALFLLDPPAQVILGVFQASSILTESLVPEAFVWNDPSQHQPAQSILPMHVRFTVLLEAQPIHVVDPELQTIFRDVGGLPMGGKIEIKEAKALANLFGARSGTVVSTESSKRGAFASTDPSSYKPPFKFVEEVPINIAASPHEVKRR